MTVVEAGFATKPVEYCTKADLFASDAAEEEEEWEVALGMYVLLTAPVHDGGDTMIFTQQAAGVAGFLR